MLLYKVKTFKIMYPKLKKFLKLNMFILGYGVINGYIDKSYKININDKEKITNVTNNAINESSVNYYNFQKEKHSRTFLIEKAKTEVFDMIIIGGGSSGAGVLQAASEKGLKVCLIEKYDFASGTSSKSTKIAHGGIRYLEEMFYLKSPIEKFLLVKEALSERDTILKSGSFINNQVELSILHNNIFMAYYYYIGMFVYHSIYRINLLFNKSFTALINGPSIKYENEDGNYFFKISLWEGQFIDTRQNILTLLSSQINKTQSIILNYTEKLEYAYDDDNKIKEVNCKDTLTGKEFTIKGKVFANCTGVFSDCNLSKKENLNNHIKSSKGTHIIVNKSIFPKKYHSHGFIIPKTSDGRLLFIIPYQGKFIIGTTDNFDEKSDLVSPTENEIDWITKEVTIYFGMNEKILKDNITSSFAGQRPIVVLNQTENSENLKSVSRKHVVYHDANQCKNLYSLFGGKWTSYLSMGEDLVNKVFNDYPLLGNSELKVDQEYKFKLNGSIENSELSYNEEREVYKHILNNLIDKYPLIPPSYIRKLITLYGINAIKILHQGEIEKTNIPLSKELSEFILIYKSELNYCIDYEHVVTTNDFLCRRRGISFLNSKLAELYIPSVAESLGSRLNWSKDHVLEDKNLSVKNMKYMI